jgi:hypothetical protein
MELGQIFLLTLVGIAAGFLNVVAGGGSLLTLPVMVFLGMSGPEANGTNRIAILAQNVAAVGGFRRQGFSNFRLSITLSLCALPGALAGAYLGNHLEGAWFNRVLAVIMVGVLLLMLFKKKSSPQSEKATELAPPGSKRFIAAHVLMVLVGFYGGFIQAGLGFLLMAVLHRVLGENLVRVNMHKVFIIGSYTFFALGIFAWQGNVDWLPGLGLAAGNAVGGWCGSYFSVKKGEGAIKLIFYVALLAMAAKLLFS